MYYSSGNYEAFARPKKPEGVDNKSAYIVGSGLAALTAACYLVRDGQMKGEHIHILEKGELPGGACDGYKFENLGYVMRGGREMDNHFEVMWDLFRSIPSIETEGVSVLDEYYWLNKEDPNYSLCRATVDRGQDAHTDGKFDISDKGAMEIMKLFFTPNEDLQDKKITDFFDDEVLNSNFWLYWRTMFAFENWHSALEMKLYIQRYIHHIGGLPDFTALRFTKYNQYESMILPMVKYLESHNVRFHYGVQVTNVEFDCSDPAHKLAKRIDVIENNEPGAIDLTENDLVFITNGGCVESTSIGSQDQPAVFNPTLRPGNGWDLWKKIAAQDPAIPTVEVDGVFGPATQRAVLALQRQQGIDLLLGGDVGAVGGDAPKGHKRGNGGIKGPAGGLTESQGGGDQVRRLLGHIGAALGVQGIDFASLPGPGQGPVQAVQFLTAGGQGLRSLVSVGGQGHIGVHGEQAQLFRLRLDAAAGKAQQKRRQHGAAYTLHSSRLPSRARISVASSANSRWPPTGMP